jgi:hypothetical protein
MRKVQNATTLCEAGPPGMSFFIELYRSKLIITTLLPKLCFTKTITDT